MSEVSTRLGIESAGIEMGIKMGIKRHEIWAYPNDALPPTSLIICTRNRPTMLVETVESILQGEDVPTEIVILDQSPVCNEVLSSMLSRRGCHVRYVQSTSVGLSRARNEGIAAAKHRLLIIADDDMFIDRKWFGSMVRTLLREGPRCVVSGAVVPSEAEVAGGFAPSLTLSDTPACHAGRPFLDPLNAGNMAMFRSAYEEIGEFDPHLGAGSEFRSAEDNDFGYRLLEAGYRVYYEPTAIIIHRAWRSADQYLPMRWNYGFGQGAFFAKHMRRDDGYIRQRMWRDVKKRALRFKERFWHERQLAKGDAVYCIGLLVGAARWAWTNANAPTPALPHRSEAIGEGADDSLSCNSDCGGGLGWGPMSHNGVSPKVNS